VEAKRAAQRKWRPKTTTTTEGFSAKNNCNAFNVGTLGLHVLYAYFLINLIHRKLFILHVQASRLQRAHRRRTSLGSSRIRHQQGDMTHETRHRARRGRKIDLMITVTGIPGYVNPFHIRHTVTIGRDKNGPYGPALFSSQVASVNPQQIPLQTSRKCSQGIPKYH